MFFLSLSVSRFLSFATRLGPDRRGLVYRCADIRVLFYVLAASPMARSTRPSSWLFSLLLFFFHSPRPSSSFSFRPHLLFLDRPLVNCLGSPSLRANFSFRIKLHTVYPACPLLTLVFLLSVFPLAGLPRRNYHYSDGVRRMQCQKHDSFRPSPRIELTKTLFIQVNVGHLCKSTTCRLIF